MNNTIIPAPAPPPMLTPEHGFFLLKLSSHLAILSMELHFFVQSVQHEHIFGDDYIALFIPLVKILGARGMSPQDLYANAEGEIFCIFESLTILCNLVNIFTKF